MSTRALFDPAPQIGVSAPAQTAIGTTAALVLAANPRRKGLVVQNTGTTVIKLTFHSSTMPTQIVYDVALKACGSADDGTGGVYVDDAYVGAVNAVSSGAGGTFILKEFTTGDVGVAGWNAAQYLGALG